MTTKQKCLENIQAIRLVKSLEKGEFLMSEQREKLLSFNGWGTIRKIFSPDKEWQQELHLQLKELLTDAEYRLAQGSILNAFYTSPEVIKGIWKGLDTLGFRGGKILEPSCGSLLFKEYQPYYMSRVSQWFAVESDSISANIAKALHPDATIYGGLGFEQVAFPDKTFDLVIGNVPFGDYSVFDSNYAHLKLKIHNYFLARSIRLTRVGGLICLITSVGTLDALGNENFREQLAYGCELVGAVRLPNSAFHQNANTEVTTDVLIFKRIPKPDNLDKKRMPWLHSQPMNDYPLSLVFFDADKEELQRQKSILTEFGIDLNCPLPLNHYYLHHPDHLLGELYLDKVIAGDRLGVKGDDRNLEDAIASAFQSFNSVYQSSEENSSLFLVPPELMREQIFAFCKWQGNIYQRFEHELVQVDHKNIDRIEQMLCLHSALDKVIEAQKWTDDNRLFEARQELTIKYDSFVEEYGYLNLSANQRILGLDPRYYLLMALEVPAKECLYSFQSLLKSKEHFSKADIFFQRTAKALESPTVADNPRDALLISLNVKGCIDIDFIAELVSKSSKEIIEELHEQPDEPLIFYDPDLKKWVLSEQYLSGFDVRAKLQRAREAGLERNVQALIRAQPLYLLPPAPVDIRAEIAARIGSELCNTDILTYYKVRLGASWIPVHVYEEFANFLLKSGKVTIHYFPAPVNGYSVRGDSRVKASVANLNEYGTKRRTALSLIESGLNLRDPVVSDTFVDANGNEYSVKNPEATEAARAMLKNIGETFTNWLWSDTDRAERLTRLYNEKLNCSVTRPYDGSHLTLTGASPDINLRHYQKNGIWRICQEKATILGWKVGAGKTIAMIGSAMELKRLGLVHKPMLVVLDSTVSQIEAEFRRLYPTARLLVLGPISPSPEARRRFVTQIATGNWDAIICSHTQFFMGIDLSPNSTLEFLNQELNLIRQYISEVKRDCKKDDDEGKINIRQLVAAEKRLENQVQKAIDTSSKRKDSVVYFEQLGVDLLEIDEFHFCKNCWRHTKMGAIAGLPNPFSQRGMDTFMKVRWLLANGGRFVGATGTPVSNTLAEAWTNLRYTILDTLQEKGLDHFDSFASAFFEMTTEAEITSIGKYKVKQRCRNIVNRPEFMSLYRCVVDIINTDDMDLGDAVPTVAEIPVACPPSEQQLDYMKHLSDRADAVELRQVDPKTDNMVWITTDGRKSALDIRLVSTQGKNNIHSKVNACVMNLFRIWDQTHDTKAAQVLFLNFSTPKFDKPEQFDLYRYIKAALVAMGVLENQIRFIHDAEASTKKRTNKLRKELYQQINAGEVRIILGSIRKLGTGVNIQERLIAAHFLDCPWTPAEIEQGRGRIERFKNKFGHVLVFKYATMGAKGQAGVDSYLWQTQENKATFIWSSLDYKNLAREVEDIAPTVLSAATMKAIAVGDPRLRRKAEVDSEIKSLTYQKQGFDQSLFRNKMDILHRREMIAEANRRLPILRRRLAYVRSLNPLQEGEIYPVYFGDTPLTKPAKIVDAAIRKLSLAKISHYDGELKYLQREADRCTLGKFLDFDIVIEQGRHSSGLGLFLTDDENPEELFPLFNPEINPRRFLDDLGIVGLRTSLEELVKKYENRLRQGAIDLQQLEAIGGATSFPHQSQLEALLEEQRYLDEELNPLKDAAIRQEKESADESDSKNEQDDEEFWLTDNSCAKFQGVEPDIAFALKLIVQDVPLPDEWRDEFIKAKDSYKGILLKNESDTGSDTDSEQTASSELSLLESEQQDYLGDDIQFPTFDDCLTLSSERTEPGETERDYFEFPSFESDFGFSSGSSERVEPSVEIVQASLSDKESIDEVALSDSEESDSRDYFDFPSF
jgi:N12 class adenine-specific DNA methylase